MKVSNAIYFILFTGIITFSCKTKQVTISKTNTTTQSTKDSSQTTNAIPDSLKLSLNNNDSNQIVLNPLDSPKVEKSFLEDKVDYFSDDSIVFDIKSKILVLFDSAQLNYTTIQLNANYVEVDLNKKELRSKGSYDSTLAQWKGNPIFKEKEQSFSAKELAYNFDSKKGLIKEAFTSQGEIYLHAEVAKKDSANNFNVKNAKFTTCSDPTHPHFYIKTNRGKVVNEELVVTGPAYFSIADVPTPLALPFGFFPNKKTKSSGIIVPEPSENTYGFFLRNMGYYFAFSDKFDLKLTGDIYTSLSFGIRAEMNYKVRYKLNGNLSLGFSQLQSGDPEIAKEFRQNRDFKISWTHTQDPKSNPTIQFNAKVDVVSASFNQLNSSNIANIANNQFASNISLSKQFRRSPVSMTLNISHAQNTQTRTVNLTLPQFTLNVMRFTPFKRKNQVGEIRWYENIGITYSMNIRNNLNTTDTSLVKDFVNELGKMNSGVLHTVDINTNFKIAKYFTFTPSINYREIWNFSNLSKFFNFTTNKLDQDTVRGFFTTRELTASANLSTIVYGMYKFRSKKIIALRHVVTPTLNINYKPNLGDWRTGFYGNNGELTEFSPNSIGVFGSASNREQSGTIGFSINNNLELKVVDKKDTITGTRKIPIFEALTFNMNYDLAKDSMNLSPLSIAGRTTLFNFIVINFGFAFDPYAANSTNRFNKFAWENGQGLMRLTNAVLNVNFAYRPKPKEKPNASGFTEAQRMVANNPLAYDYVDFNVPYSVSIGYNIQMSKQLDKETIVHAINFTGDVSITKNWKIATNFNFDIQNKKVGVSKFSLIRDLHCFEMSADVIPFGANPMYTFTIRAKSPLLQFLKFNRQSGVNGVF